MATCCEGSNADRRRGTGSVRPGGRVGPSPLHQNAPGHDCRFRTLVAEHHLGRGTEAILTQSASEGCRESLASAQCVSLLARRVGIADGAATGIGPLVLASRPVGFG